MVSLRWIYHLRTCTSCIYNYFATSFLIKEDQNTFHLLHTSSHCTEINVYIKRILPSCPLPSPPAPLPLPSCPSFSLRYFEDIIEGEPAFNRRILPFNLVLSYPRSKDLRNITTLSPAPFSPFFSFLLCPISFSSSFFLSSCIYDFFLRSDFSVPFLFSETSVISPQINGFLSFFYLCFLSTFCGTWQLCLPFFIRN